MNLGWIGIGVGIVLTLILSGALYYEYQQAISLTRDNEQLREAIDKAAAANRTLDTSVKAFEAEAARSKLDALRKQEEAAAAAAEVARYRAMLDGKQRELNALIAKDMAREDCRMVLEQDLGGACPELGAKMKDWQK